MRNSFHEYSIVMILLCGSSSTFFFSSSTSSSSFPLCFSYSFILSFIYVCKMHWRSSYLHIEIICDEQWLSIKCVLGFYLVFLFQEIDVAYVYNSNNKNHLEYIYIYSITILTLNGLFCTIFPSEKKEWNTFAVSDTREWRNERNISNLMLIFIEVFIINLIALKRTIIIANKWNENVQPKAFRIRYQHTLIIFRSE